MAPKGEENEFITKEDLEQLLAYKLGPFVQVETFTAIPLTKPGENYGSNILAVDATLKMGHKKLPLVVKLVPISPFLRMVFQCEITVRKEMDMYLLVSPEYEEIQKENQIPADEFLDVFPLCYGARATKGKDVGQPADADAALVLENLKVRGYECGERAKGFDLAHTTYILKHLARFHATAVAIKFKKPEVFEKTVKKACVRIRVGPPPNEDSDNNFVETSKRFLKNIPGCEKYIDKLVDKIKKEEEKREKKAEAPPPAEPFATISHNDFWTNNMMVTYANNSDRTVPAGLKIVDFQVITYDSPAKDLLFFLYSSTQVGLVEKHYDEFVGLYHKSFVDWLERLGCDVTQFSLEKFLEEIDRVAPDEFIHTFFMLRPICMKENDVPDLASFDGKSFEAPDESSLEESFFSKVKTLLDDFARRGWF